MDSHRTSRCAPTPGSSLGICLLVGALSVPGSALAQEAPGVAPPVNAAPAARAGRGFGVISIAGSGDSTWPLAQAVYASSLRPSRLDEAHARILAGEAAPEGSARELADLAETRAALSGNDAPSRRLLLSIAASHDLEGLVTLRVEEGVPVARVFLAETRDFDAAEYRADPVSGWAPLVKSLERGRASNPLSGARSAQQQGPALAVAAPARKDTGESRPFYTSGWFWGAVGAAAFAGGAIYFMTRDTDSGSIRLTMKVPQ